MAFRRQLLGWFGGLLLALLVTLAALLRWVLAPLRRMEREIHEVEEGRSETLGAGYPRELAGVAGNLNALLLGERKRVGALPRHARQPRPQSQDAARGDAREPARGCVRGDARRRDRSHEGHHRAPAEARRRHRRGAPRAPPRWRWRRWRAELRGALLKVYADKDLCSSWRSRPGSAFIGDRGDLLELLGNLLDNACKWCRSRVRLSAAADAQAPARQRLRLTIEDDGPGIAPEDRDRVLDRGVRTDEKVPGHGLGLAMVRDTIELYGGALAIEASDLGGARFTVHLPGR